MLPFLLGYVLIVAHAALWFVLAATCAVLRYALLAAYAAVWYALFAAPFATHATLSIPTALFLFARRLLIGMVTPAFFRLVDRMEQCRDDDCDGSAVLSPPSVPGSRRGEVGAVTSTEVATDTASPCESVDGGVVCPLADARCRYRR